MTALHGDPSIALDLRLRPPGIALEHRILDSVGEMTIFVEAAPYPSECS